MTDHQLGAIDNIDPGFLATVAVEQETEGQQEPWHQDHKPAGAGEISKKQWRNSYSRPYARNA